MADACHPHWIYAADLAEYGQTATPRYEAGLVEPADFRLTCFFVDRDYRREGVSAVAQRGALDLIAEAGGGIVEGFPRDTPERRPRPRSSTTAPETFSNRPASSTSGRRARIIV
jgi:hypothetical protein